MKKKILLFALLFSSVSLFATEKTAYLSLNDNNFMKETAGKLVFIDFYADWCGPCQQFAPVFEAVAQALPQFTFVKVDTDNSPKLSTAFKVTSIPYIVAFKDNKVIAKFNSYPRTEKTFTDWVQKVAKAVEKQK